MMPNGVRCSLDLQGHMEGDEQTPLGFPAEVVQPHHVTDVLTFDTGNMQELLPPFLLTESKMDEGVNHYVSDSLRPNAVEGGVDKSFGDRGKEDTVWNRTKWTDDMVKVLITAVSYVGDDDSSLCGNPERTKPLLCPKKGKWRAISDVMVERGYFVSPQQCEDKFNDLNKKFKRLNAILGKGITCNVVENPVLMESIDLPYETKEEAKRLLNCKQLFYREMCSYHNGNRLFLPHDRALQRSLLFAIKGKKAISQSERLVHGIPAKRMRQEDECEVRLTSQVGLNTKSGEAANLWGERLMSRALELQEEKLKLQAQMLELEKRRMEWMRYRHKKDRELQEMRLEIEAMKLENERLAYELKLQSIGANDN